MPVALWYCWRSISIHAPREGGDRGPDAGDVQDEISIHAPREGGDRVVSRSRLRLDISIHAPREGGDASFWFISGPCSVFQSTPPARGATASLNPTKL